MPGSPRLPGLLSACRMLPATGCLAGWAGSGWAGEHDVAEGLVVFAPERGDFQFEVAGT